MAVPISKRCDLSYWDCHWNRDFERWAASQHHIRLPCDVRLFDNRILWLI